MWQNPYQAVCLTHETVCTRFPCPTRMPFLEFLKGERTPILGTKYVDKRLRELHSWSGLGCATAGSQTLVVQPKATHFTHWNILKM